MAKMTGFRCSIELRLSMYYHTAPKRPDTKNWNHCGLRTGDFKWHMAKMAHGTWRFAEQNGTPFYFEKMEDIHLPMSRNNLDPPT